MSAAKSVRPRRVFAGLKQRRRGAAPMFETDQTPAEVAHALGVSRQSVSRWAEQYLAGGAARLHGAGSAGRKPTALPPSFGPCPAWRWSSRESPAPQISQAMRGD